MSVQNEILPRTMNPHLKRHTAFTLIELLLVIAVIAVLAAIAIPNMMDAQVRAKVARTKNGLRVVAGAFEAYRIDHHAYPPWYVYPYFINYRLLTTPLAYLNSVQAALDPFSPQLKLPDRVTVGEPYFTHSSFDPLGKDTASISPEENAWRKALDEYYGRWVILSHGPTGNPFREYDDSTVSVDHGMTTTTRYLSYDPTNGTNSPGVIAWTQRRGLLAESR